MRKRNEDSGYYFDKVCIYEPYLPVKEFQHCIRKTTETMPGELYQYSHPEGVVLLRKEICWSLEEEGIYADIEQIIITSGITQALHLLFQMIRSEDKEILIENPTYELIKDLLKSYSIRYRVIKRDFEGYNFKTLEEELRHVDFFFLMPNHHNPLGTTLDNGTKKKLLTLCRKYKVKLIEDDYLADILPQKTHKSLLYLSSDEPILYLRSFSKGFLPGIRLGYIVVPKEEGLVDKLLHLKKMTDHCSPTLNQLALSYYIKTGMYKRHIQKMRVRYKRRMNKVNGALDNFVSDKVNCSRDDSGIYIYISIKGKFNDLLLKKWLMEQKIYVQWIEDNYRENNYQENNVQEKPRTCLRLCILGMSDEMVIEGISKLFIGLNKIVY